MRLLQSQKLPRCTIEVKLVIGNGSVSRVNLDIYATQIASLVKQMHDRQAVGITITFCSSRGATLAPPSQMLQLLAPCISQIDYYSVRREQVVEGCHVYQTYSSVFTPEHITALQESSTQLQTLHISDHDGSLFSNSSLAPSMADIARFVSLTSLHLTLTAIGTEVDFQPLAHLSLLTNLALQFPVLISGTTRSCNGVLSSSKQSLHHVILTAAAWDVDTYLSLQACSQLKSVCIRVWQVSTADAEQLGCVQADGIQLTLLTPYRLQADTLQALTASVPRIRELTCEDIPYPLGSYLQRLPSLESLHLFLAEEVLNEGLQPQLSIKNLYLHGFEEILCCKKVHNLMKAFPNLSCIWIDKVHGKEFQSLEILAAGAHLTSISLVSFDGITDEHISRMHWAFHRQQALGKAEPLVKVYLRPNVKPPIDLSSCTGWHNGRGAVPISWHCKAALVRRLTVKFRKGVEPLPGQKYIDHYDRWC